MQITKSAEWSSRTVGAVLAAVTLLAACGQPADLRSEEALGQSPSPTLGAVSPTSEFETAPPAASAPRVVPQLELQQVADTAFGDRVVIGDPMATDSGASWWVTAWTGRSIGIPDVYCVGTPRGVSCRSDGDEVDAGVRLIGWVRPGLILEAHSGVSSVTLSTNEPAESPVELHDLDLPSGRFLFTFPLQTTVDIITVSAYDVDGSRLASIDVDVNELRQGDRRKGVDAESEGHSASAPTEFPKREYAPQELLD